MSGRGLMLVKKKQIAALAAGVGLGAWCAHRNKKYPVRRELRFANKLAVPDWFVLRWQTREENSVKKVKISFLELCVLLIFLPGCDRYRGPEPDPDDLWISENPMISFVAMNEDLGFPTGEMMIDGELLEIDVLFDNGSHMSVFKAVRDTSAYGTDDELVFADIVIRGDLMIASVKRKQPGIWEGIDRVTFRKEHIESNE